MDNNGVSVARANADMLRRINQSGCGAAYVLIIQCLSTMIYLTIVRRRRRRNRMVQTELAFVIWFGMLNVILAGLCGFFIRKGWLPQVPPVTYGALFMGVSGAYISASVDMACVLQDSPASRRSYTSPDAFSSRVWMHTAVAFTISMAALILFS